MPSCPGWETSLKWAVCCVCVCVCFTASKKWKLDYTPVQRCVKVETFYSQKAGLSLDLWFRFKVQVEKMQLW